MFLLLATSFRAAFPGESVQILNLDINKGFWKGIKTLIGLPKGIVVLNCSVLGTTYWQTLLLRLLGNKIVLYPHLVVDHVFMGSKLPRLRNLLMKLSLRNSEAAIAISEGNEPPLRRLFPRLPLVRCRNFVPCENKEPIVRVAGDLKRIAIIGRIQEKHKHQQRILSALGPILPGSNLELHFFGDGPDMPSLLEAVETRGVRLQCRLHGWTEEHRIFEQDFGIVLNYSSWEGLPLSLLESIFRDKVVLASDIPGNRELLDPGFLFSSDAELVDVVLRVQRWDPRDLAAALDVQKRAVYGKFNRGKSLAVLHDQVVLGCPSHPNP